MFDKIFKRGKRLVTGPQNSVLSAATIIMFMVVASRVLGLVRQRVLAHFFTPESLSLFFAAFRLPDLVFEVLVFGTFSSAFIPVFTKALNKSKKEAWDIAGRVVNIGLLIFIVFAFCFSFFSEPFYTILAPGYSVEDTRKIASIAKILFAAQGFFVVSYVLTGVLESLRRFLISALAPVFYNLGIILGTLIFSPFLGLPGPGYGVFLGALLHFSVQLPFAYKLGFRFSRNIKPTQGVIQIARLAIPRVIDLSFQQIAKTVELFFASIISTASYTYFTFANTLQLLPVGIFGVSLAKASLPTLSAQSEDYKAFRKTLFTTLYQIVFLVLPLSTTLIVLRIPIVRLVFGTGIFDWQSTVQTGLVLTAFAVGIVFQSASALLARGFYALHDTKTPVAISIGAVLITIASDIILVGGFSLPVWALAASFSLGAIFQALLLFFFLVKRIDHTLPLDSIIPMIKSFIAALASGIVMFFFLKLFDRSVWVKRLSFLQGVDPETALSFNRFVLDTRYTVNLFILTSLVALVGFFVYLMFSYFLKSQELASFVSLLKRRKIGAPPTKEAEPLSLPTSESVNT